MNTFTNSVSITRRTDAPKNNYQLLLEKEHAAVLENLTLANALEAKDTDFYEHVTAFMSGELGVKPSVSAGTFKKDWLRFTQLLGLSTSTVHPNREATAFYTENPAFLGIVANWALSYCLAELDFAVPEPIRSPIFLYGASAAILRSVIKPLYWSLRYASIPVTLTNAESGVLHNVSADNIIEFWENQDGIAFCNLMNVTVAQVNEVKERIAGIGIDFHSYQPLIVCVNSAYKDAKTGNLLLEFKHR